MADPYQARGQALDGKPAGRAGTRVPSGGSGSIRWPVRDAQAALIRRYVQVGVVRSIWRDSPCMDGQSFRAAVAARTTGVQGKLVGDSAEAVGRRTCSAGECSRTPATALVR